MRSKSFEGMACSIAGVLEAIGDRWAVLILRDLSLGLARYEDLRRSTGVTNATLSDRLKHLEDHELIERRRYQVNPERYEYVLTRKGRDTILLLQALAQGKNFGDAVPITPFLPLLLPGTIRIVSIPTTVVPSANLPVKNATVSVGRIPLSHVSKCVITPQLALPCTLP